MSSARKSTSDAVRQRRYRDRLRREVIVVPVEVNYALIAKLIDDRSISPAESRDAQSLGKAISNLLHQIFRYA